MPGRLAHRSAGALIQVEARARLVVHRTSSGRSAAAVVRGEAPLLLRVTEEAAARVTVHLVGGAAGPLGGDRLGTEVDVQPGASLAVRSVAASLAQPDRQRRASVATVHASVGASASLDWRPEPLVSVRGSDHVQRTRLDCSGGARVRWVDEVVLGRHDEPSGRLTMEQRVRVDGAPLVHHTVLFDPRLDPTGVTGSARAVVSVLEIHAATDGSSACPFPTALVRPSVRCSRFALGPSSTMWLALGDDLGRAWAGLDEIGFGRVSREGTSPLTNTMVGQEDSPMAGLRARAGASVE